MRDPNSTFPEVGKVFSVEPNTLNADVGSFWLFTTETNTRYEPGRGHDKILARDPRPAIQVIDYSGLTLESARRELVEIGLPTSQALTGEAIVRLKGDFCVRLKLVQDAATGRRRADISGLDDLAVMRCPSQVTAGATVAGATFLLPGREPREVVDHVDWSPDSDFLERTLKRVRRVRREDGRGEDVTNLSISAIEALSQYLRRAGPPLGNRDPLHRMRRRLEDFLPDFKASMGDLDAVVIALETFRPVAERISSDVEAQRIAIDAELRCRLEPIIRKELEERHSTAVAALERVHEEIAAAQSTHAELLRQEEALTRSIGDLKTALMSDLGAMHDAFENASVDASGAVTTIVRRVSDVLLQTSIAVELTPPATPPWGLGTITPDSTLIDVDGLRERLDAEADRSGIEATDLITFDALLRAGELVVFVGQRDLSLLEAYARSVAGGRLRKLVVDPAVIGLDDLWRQAGSGAPTPFAKAFTAARAHPDQMVLMTIECLNVAPLGFWLPGFVTALHGPDRPRNLLIAGTLTASEFTNQGSLAVLRRIAIPLLAEPATDAWMRSALRVAGQEALEPPTVLNASRDFQLSTDDTAQLMAELTSVSGLRPGGAARAVKVMQSARCTMEREHAIQLALDVGRIASGDGDVVASVTTPSVARGIRGLADLLHRNEI